MATSTSVAGLAKRFKRASRLRSRWPLRAATLMLVAAGHIIASNKREFATTTPTTLPSGAHRHKNGTVASSAQWDEVHEGSVQSPSSTDWKAALRVMGAAAANGTGSNIISNDGDVVTFPSFVDAHRLAPQATFGILAATCTVAFDDEVPTTTIGSATVFDFNSMKSQAAVPSYQQKLRSEGAPALAINDLTKRFGDDEGNGHATAIDQDRYFIDGGERIVWILAGHVTGDAVRYAEEAMRSRVRLYPKSRIVLVDNDSPPVEAESLRRLAETMPGNHRYVSNPPPSRYEQGAYRSGIRELRTTVPRPPEGEIVVFTQATTVVLRPLPLDEIFEGGCDLRPMYQPCCGQLETPPCDESKQTDWLAESGNIFATGRYPPDPTCKRLCPNRTCVLNYTDSFGPYRDRICDRRPATGLMHASMITTGALARDVLFGGLGFELPCKMSEKLSGYWRLAGKTQPGASCTASLDIDKDGSSNLSYFTYKFHGAAEVWGQRLQARFLRLLQTLDDDSDGEVTFGEMTMDERRWKQSAREFCMSAFMDDGHRHTIKRYIELAAEWYDWCSVKMNTTIAEEESFYHPIMCEAARAIRNNSTTLLGSYYKRWLQHCKLIGC